MLKYTKIARALTQNIKYNFQPPSCYNIEAKPNPVVCVTLGNDQGAFCDLHFRVN